MSDIERFLIDVETGKERRMTPDEIREDERRDRDWERDMGHRIADGEPGLIEDYED